MNKRPLPILNRDNWTCQLCGVATPIELRGTTHPNAPEVDHIIPKSRGGLLRDPDNLRCVCRACNTKKSLYLDHELKDAFAPDGTIIKPELVAEATARMREGSRKAGIATHKKHPELYKEWGYSLGKLYGPIGGKATKESTNGRKSTKGCMPPETRQRICKIAGAVVGRINANKPGYLVAISKHRWHRQLNKPDDTCPYCQKQVVNA